VEISERADVGVEESMKYGRGYSETGFESMKYGRGYSETGVEESIKYGRVYSESEGPGKVFEAQR